MHTSWKGAINFGLVNVPVKMFLATEQKDIAFKQIHKGCGHPISTSRNCPNCLHEVNSEDIARGFQYDKDTFVIFEKKELEQLTGDKNKEIRILDFVECQDIDPVFYQRTYYLAPEGIGVRFCIKRCP